MLNINQLITYWNNVRRVTLEFIDAYPPGFVDFKPVDTMFTGLQQFQHLISSQTMLVRGWTNGVWGYVWEDGQWRAPELIDETFNTLPGLRHYYTSVHDRAMEFLASLPDDGRANVFETHIGTLSVEALILYAIDEEIHHRGQLVVYLRMLGIVPPMFVQRYQELME